MALKTSIRIVAVALLCVVSTDAKAQLGGLFGGPKIETISTTELKTLLEQQQKSESLAKDAGKEPPQADFVLVDVRSDKEINVSIIPGAITKAQYERNRVLYQGRTVVPYCTIGGRSGAYAKQLAKSNVKVKNYKGSIVEWVEAGLPVVTLDGKPTNRVHTYSDRYRIPANYEKVTQ